MNGRGTLWESYKATDKSQNKSRPVGVLTSRRVEMLSSTLVIEGLCLSLIAKKGSFHYGHEEDLNQPHGQTQGTTKPSYH